MATVMQDTASSSTKKPRVAERSFREVISHKFDRDDTSMEVYARVWHDEVVEERCGSRHPKTESYFSVSGRWATERLLEVPVEYYSQTSRYLFVCVADAWLCSTNVEYTKLLEKCFGISHLPQASWHLQQYVRCSNHGTPTARFPFWYRGSPSFFWRPKFLVRKTRCFARSPRRWENMRRWKT